MRIVIAGWAIVGVLVAGVVPTAAATPTTVRADVTKEGVPSGGAGYPSISGNGRFVAFEASHGLLPGADLNTASDVYVFDRTTGRNTRVSVRSDGKVLNDWTGYAAISVNGRFVTYCGAASNAVNKDRNEKDDVFVHDRKTGRTIIASLSSEGRQGDGSSCYSNVSSDGRWVAFASEASNLVKGDTNGTMDLFLRDTVRRTTRIVTRGYKGKPANGNTSFNGPSQVSADGRVLVFSSAASNLVRGDTNGQTDIFAWDRATGRIRRLSVGSDGRQADGTSNDPAISADGRYVVFQSASALVPGDTNGKTDIFIRDLKSGTIRIVSVSSEEGAGDSASSWASVSADGRYVAFESFATNLVAGDTNGTTDVFVRDRKLGVTRRVSVAADGVQADKGGYFAYVSADGRFVVFQSSSTNLIPGQVYGDSGIYLRGPLR